MSGRRRTVLISVAVLAAVLPSCSSGADPQGAPGTVADATTSASQSATGGSSAVDANGSDGSSGDQTGDRSDGSTTSASTDGRAAPPTGSGAGRTAPPAGSGTGGDPPPADSGTGGAAPPASSAAGGAAPPASSAAGRPAPPAGPATGNEAPPAGPATSSSAPPADTGAGRPGGEPAGGSSSPARVGGAPPDADIIDRLGAFFSFDDFRAAQLAECGADYPDCVRLEIDPDQVAAGADGSWCAVATTPDPKEDGLNAFVLSKPPGEAVIVVTVVPPGVDDNGAPLCDGSQGPPA